MRLPRNVAEILNTLTEHGFEAYIVGGCVRDFLLGRTPKDYDITTQAKPEQVKKLFVHTYDTGIAHGTVTVVLDKENYEVTTYRTDGVYEDCRHPSEVFFTDSLTEDLRRRDFTMNAVAFHPDRGFQDPFSGRADMEKRCIRGVGEPDARFQEDALRMLRAVRFAVQLGFTIEKETMHALSKNKRLIKNVSGERIHQELEKLFLSEYMEKLPLLWESGLLAEILPEIEEIEKKKESLLPSLSRSGKNFALRFALFLEGMEEKTAVCVMKRLKFDTKTLREIVMLLQYADKEIRADRFQIKKTAGILGEREFSAVLAYQTAKEPETAEEVWKLWRTVLEKREPFLLTELKINGSRLLELGIPKGKEIGAVLAWLLEEVQREPEKNNPDILENLVGEWVRNKEGQT